MTGTPLPPDDGTPPTEDGAALAAELALGLLDGDDRAAAMRRVLTDPAFAADVERWRAHFGVLFEDWPEATPPPDGLARLEAALAPARLTANDNPPAATSNRLWQGIAGLSSLIAATLAGVMVLRPAPVSPPPPPVVVQAAAGPVLVAALAPTSKGAPIAAIYDGTRGDSRIGAAALADSAHSAELWVIPATDKVPRSLGLLRAGDRTALAITAANQRRFAAGATLAVTLEAPGGSPDGTPKGPVVAAGSLTQI